MTSPWKIASVTGARCSTVDPTQEQASAGGTLATSTAGTARSTARNRRTTMEQGRGVRTPGSLQASREAAHDDQPQQADQDESEAGSGGAGERGRLTGLDR